MDWPGRLLLKKETSEEFLENKKKFTGVFCSRFGNETSDRNVLILDRAST